MCIRDSDRAGTELQLSKKACATLLTIGLPNIKDAARKEERDSCLLMTLLSRRFRFVRHSRISWSEYWLTRPRADSPMYRLAYVQTRLRANSPKSWSTRLRRRVHLPTSANSFGLANAIDFIRSHI